MKRMVLVSWMLLSLAVGAMAQTEEPTMAAPVCRPLTCFSLGVHFSFWDAADLHDFDIAGAVGGGVIGQVRLHKHLALDFRLSGYASGFSRDVYEEGLGWSDDDFTLVAMPFELGVVGILPMGQKVSVYGGPGVGYYLFDGQFTRKRGKATTIYDVEMADNPGGYLLGGLKMQLTGNLALYCEGKYVWVDTTVRTPARSRDEWGLHDIRVNLDMSGLMVNAGLLFTF